LVKNHRFEPTHLYLTPQLGMILLEFYGNFWHQSLGYHMASFV